MLTKSELISLLKSKGIITRRSLGQNFLIDHNFLKFIIKTAQVTPDDYILEIGSGPGTLTNLISQNARYVWAVEIDKKLIEFAQSVYSSLTNVCWLNTSILDKNNNTINSLVIEEIQQGCIIPLNPPLIRGVGGIKEKDLITTGYHLPYNPNLIKRAKDLRKNMTPAEKKLWYSYLKNFTYPILRQRPINNYIVDFYCPKLKLVIEIDGETHFTEEGKVYDNKRTVILESYGLKILRFTNIDVLENLEGVSQVIEHQITLNNEQSLLNPPLIRGVGGIKVISNLPYATSAQIILALLESRLSIKSMLLMIQSEMAERLTAPIGTKSYNALTILANLLADIKIIRKIPPDIFYPAPDVTSALIMITPRASRYDIPDYEELKKVIQSVFHYRRKTIAGALKHITKLSPEKITGLLTESGIKPAKRPEEISLQEYLKLNQGFLARRGVCHQSENVSTKYLL